MADNTKKEQKDNLTDLVQVLLTKPASDTFPVQVIAEDGKPITLTLKPKKEEK
jgi:hypothetical protein